MQSPGDIITLIEPYITGPLPEHDRAGDMRLLIDPPPTAITLHSTNKQSIIVWTQQFKIFFFFHAPTTTARG